MRALVQVLMFGSHTFLQTQLTFIKVASKIEDFDIGRQLVVDRLDTRPFFSKARAFFGETHAIPFIFIALATD